MGLKPRPEPASPRFRAGKPIAPAPELERFTNRILRLPDPAQSRELFAFFEDDFLNSV
jgi:hypothetical protein